MGTSRDLKYRKSTALYEEACEYLAGGVSSNFRLGGKPAPLFFTRAAGSKLLDVDGNEYIDYTLGMGPSILGHAPSSVIKAVADSLGRGQLYAGQHQAELSLARKICELVPCAERVRLGMTGSEVVQAALRLARAYTGRPKIIRFEGHYHGWFDNILASAQPDPADAGSKAALHTVPASPGQDPLSLQNLITMPWNDLDVLARRLDGEKADEIAGIIMEPIMCNGCFILPGPGYLEGVRQLCSDRGVILIFDEVITGFRVGLSGAQGLLGVIPDLAVFAKALGAGFPISCLAGRRNLMELLGTGQVMHAGTYNAHTVCCAAANAALKDLARRDGAVYKKMRKLGRQLMAGLEKLGRESKVPLRAQGLGTVFHTCFTEQKAITHYREYSGVNLPMQSRFVELLQDCGVRITSRGTWFLSAAHRSRDIEDTLEAARLALAKLQPEF